MSESNEIWVVDRLEGDAAVLVRDADAVVVEVARTRFSNPPHEGDVLRVPVRPDGDPDWAASSLDEVLRQERLQRARSRLDELRRRDPGGDVVL